MDLADYSSASVAGGASDVPSVEGRNRAFSFEFFAFGMNGDDPLPPLEQPSSDALVGSNAHAAFAFASESPAGRPRGDSIIFDPVSFQDGGIHEQHELLERTGIVPKKPSRATAVAARSVSTGGSAAASSKPLLVHSHASSSNGNAPAFSLDLLNKDGRIGIYLPEARRARIARFHAKRSKRIWRKRIKYDCRKKLADSRPRIKGRFVKRSDVDEEQ